VKKRKPIAVLRRYYRQYLDDQDTAAFIKKVSSRYLVATLERLATNDHREVRRAAILALGFLADYDSNAVIGRALVDQDRLVRLCAENGIRNVWARSGSEAQQQQLGVVIQANLSGRYEEALERANQLLEEAPAFAEVLNQRAIAKYHLERYEEAIGDCRNALKINPFHFGAAAGMGQCYLQLGLVEGALRSFQRALRLNPGLDGIRAGVAYLERTLRNQS
jgi:tetratricopeptide (TPR) repeat protein